MKNKKYILIAIFLIIVGILIICVPFILMKLDEFNQEKLILEYENSIKNIDNNEKEIVIDEQTEYNENIENQENLSLYNIYNNSNSSEKVLGYIYIPKINLKRLIYEGSSEKILKIGIGHMENTSLPIGGSSTHSVLVGHTGLMNKVMFDNINKLQIGDKFYIKNISNTLEYTVEKTLTVLPDQIEELNIKPDQDLVTLVTCTPKHVNTHRLLVIAKRTG